MLVLSRKVDQILHIGPEVTVSVLEICGGKVMLGIEAPERVDVVRAELLAGSFKFPGFHEKR